MNGKEDIKDIYNGKEDTKDIYNEVENIFNNDNTDFPKTTSNANYIIDTIFNNIEYNPLTNKHINGLSIYMNNEELVPDEQVYFINNPIRYSQLKNDIIINWNKLNKNNKLLIFSLYNEHNSTSKYKYCLLTDYKDFFVIAPYQIEKDVTFDFNIVLSFANLISKYQILNFSKLSYLYYVNYLIKLPDNIYPEIHLNYEFISEQNSIITN